MRYKYLFKIFILIAIPVAIFAADPEFLSKPFIYAMHSCNKNGKPYNGVIKMKDNGDTGKFEKIIIDNLWDVVEGPDGSLYFLSNNRDGRGNPKSGDDKIYRIVPK